MSLIRPAAVIALLALALSAPLEAGETIYFKTSPPPEQLRANGGTATLSLLVTEANGKPVQEGWLDIALDAPASGRLFSTDFPLVEGTRLIEARLPLRRGRTEWKYAFPIRGQYRLTVGYIRSDKTQTRKSFAFTVHENPKKWIALGAFLAVLFILGALAGRIFSARAQRRLGMISGLALWIIAFGAQPARGGMKNAGEEVYSATLEAGPARVGRAASVRWRLIANAPAPKGPVALALSITNLEQGEIVFAVEKIFVGAEFKMNFHFTDGAPYKISAVADIAGTEPLRSETTISVAAVEPPAGAAVPALALFIATIACGLAAGRWSCRVRGPARR